MRNYGVAATPLESIGWKSDIGEIRFRWRPVDPEMRRAFLEDLIEGVTKELTKVESEITSSSQK